MLSRTLASQLRSLVPGYPVVLLTGPRQSGKTTLATSTFPEFEYVNLEDLQNRQEAAEDPRGFVRRYSRGQGVIVDEAQYVPELFSYIQVAVDSGQVPPFVLTGSQNFQLSNQVSQSLAGRAAIVELLPFSMAELREREALPPTDFHRDSERVLQSERGDLWDLLWRGLFPPIHDRGLEPRKWYESYVRTYVERDVRLLTNIGDLRTFNLFLRLCAGRAGQVLNMSSLGNDVGVAHTTVKRWLSILEASYVLSLLPPHHRTFRKRLVRRPKIQFLDTGLLCYLLGIRSKSDLEVHPLRGSIFESFVVSEYRKRFLHFGESAPLYFWRDNHGHEVDLVVDLGSELFPIEVKSGSTVHSDALKGLKYFSELSGTQVGSLVYGGESSYERLGFQILEWSKCS